MGSGRDLAEAIWPAINIDMMHSQAWSLCFTGAFRHEHYRQIVQVVIFRAATTTSCVLGELRGEIADAFRIDDKTVTKRIERMEDNGLLALSVDPADRRRTLVAPTAKLVEAYTKYSDHLVDLQIEFRNQMEKRDRHQRVHKRTPELYFDLLQHVPDRRLEGPKAPRVTLIDPNTLEVLTARK